MVIANIERESQTTLRVLRAIPAERESYSPHAKSRTAFELAWRLAGDEVWVLDSIADGRFDGLEPERPEEIRSAADVASWYERNIGRALDRVRGLTGEKLLRILDYGGAIIAPAYVHLNLSMLHIIHHRGQLSVYLRPMGGAVPSIFGPSGDEPAPDSAAQA
ncbi:MAG: DinB family protein [Bryobacteraceae bacterium]